MTAKSQTTETIARATGGQLQGPGNIEITGLEALDFARPGQLTFVGSGKYAGKWPDSQASAALVTRGVNIEPDEKRAVITVDNADLAMADALALFAPPLATAESGIHPSAIVHPAAQIADSAKIGPGCAIGPNVVIGANSVLYPNVTILDDSHIGKSCIIWPGVVMRERCKIGDRCILHPHVTIGADGFGYRPAQGENGVYLKKIPQIGNVEIADDVEIGAGSCVDRGKFSTTFIGKGSKIDNLVQIAHNCRIGRNVVIAGCAGIGGSVVIGDGVMIGGMAAVRDHITIGAGAVLSAGAQLMNNIPAGETWGGILARPIKQAIREALALKKLPALVKQLKRS